MVRRVGFGDGDVTDSGPVSRGEPPRKTRKPATKKPTKEKPASPPVSGRPRWGAALFLMLFLIPWLGMFFLVLTGMIKRASEGIPVLHMVWVALSLLGTTIILRKIRHLLRGGSWLQTPEDVARKTAGNDG